MATLDQIEHRGIGDEEAAVDQAAVARRLLAEGGDQLAVELQRAEAAGRGDGGDRRALAVRLVKRHQGRDVDVRHAIAISEAKGLARRQVVGRQVSYL